MKCPNEITLQSLYIWITMEDKQLWPCPKTYIDFPCTKRSSVLFSKVCQFSILVSLLYQWFYKKNYFYRFKGTVVKIWSKLLIFLNILYFSWSESYFWKHLFLFRGFLIMKTTFSYFQWMFENPAPAKIILKNKIKNIHINYTNASKNNRIKPPFIFREHFL